MTFEEEILAKIDNGEELDDYELDELKDFSVCDEEGDIGRWRQSIRSICKLNNRYFELYWEQGLTECQDNEYLEQPKEVKPITYTQHINITRTVTDYVDLETDEGDYIAKHKNITTEE